VRFCCNRPPAPFLTSTLSIPLHRYCGRQQLIPNETPLRSLEIDASIDGDFLPAFAKIETARGTYGQYNYALNKWGLEIASGKFRFDASDEQRALENVLIDLEQAFAKWIRGQVDNPNPTQIASLDIGKVTLAPNAKLYADCEHTYEAERNLPCHLRDFLEGEMRNVGGGVWMRFSREVLGHEEGAMPAPIQFGRDENNRPYVIYGVSVIPFKPEGSIARIQVEFDIDEDASGIPGLIASIKRFESSGKLADSYKLLYSADGKPPTDPEKTSTNPSE
jgi:hypothetical protein